MTVAQPTNGQHDPDRDWMIRALRGDITSEGAYQIVRTTRYLWRNGQLHGDPEAVAALNIGDNAHLDDPKRFEPFDETWNRPEADYDPATEAAFDELTRREDFAAGYQPHEPDPDPEWDWDDEPPAQQQAFINWDEFWIDDGTDEEWLVDQVFAKRRGHALYAQAKQGKSLFVLWAAAHLAANNPDVDVIYLDYEMTRSDVRDRLEDMGYGPTSDLTRFHYALLPTIPALDTLQGANAINELITRVHRPGCDLFAVIDTYGRAVHGEENLNDTTREFYRWTGTTLKRREVTWVRLDHAGKDATKGQRGGSAKNDDVDIVWKLHAGDDGAVTLHRDASRMSWVAEKVTFTRSDNPLRYESGTEWWPAGTKQLAEEIRALGLPADMLTRRKIRPALDAAGIEARNDVLGKALKYLGTTPGTTLLSKEGTELGTTQ